MQRGPRVRVQAEGALPVDSVGNPWSGGYVYNSGNLVLDLMYNLMLESTGCLQKCRMYEMTANKAARSTISYRIVREQAPEGVPMEISPERLEEFAPGLDTDLMELIQQTAEMAMADIDATFGKMK